MFNWKQSYLNNGWNLVHFYPEQWQAVWLYRRGLDFHWWGKKVDVESCVTASPIKFRSRSLTPLSTWRTTDHDMIQIPTRLHRLALAFISLMTFYFLSLSLGKFIFYHLIHSLDKRRILIDPLLAIIMHNIHYPYSYIPSAAVTYIMRGCHGIVSGWTHGCLPVASRL